MNPRSIYPCDVYGIPLSVKDTVQLYADYPTLADRLFGEVIQIYQMDKEAIVQVKWSDGVKSEYRCESMSDSSFPKLSELRKMVNINGRWVAATF